MSSLFGRRLCVHITTRYPQQTFFNYERRSIFTQASSTTTIASPTNKNIDKKEWNRRIHREFSSNMPTTTTTAAAAPVVTPSPPKSITKDIAMGVQEATSMYLHHGAGRQLLDAIAKDAGQGPSTLVKRWQKMMEAFLSTQLHVLVGLGYPSNENGIALYNQQLGDFMSSCDPKIQEELRLASRDSWRHVLMTSFALSMDQLNDKETGIAKEWTIVEAREMMHKVATRMQEPDILESIAKRASSLVVSDTNNAVEDATKRHAIIQDVLVNQVYLGDNPSLVSQCGFGDGEEGYVLMQCVMAEYQQDPLVTQYIGLAMTKIMQSAGLDLTALQNAASSQKK